MQRITDLADEDSARGQLQKMGLLGHLEDMEAVSMDTDDVIYKTEWMGAAAMAPRDSNGATAATVDDGGVTVDYYAFPHTAVKYVHFCWGPPDNWDLAALKIKLVWAPATGATATNGASWGIASVVTGDGDTIGTSFPTVGIIDDALGTVGKQHISPASGNIPRSGTAAKGDVVYFELSREVGETLDNMVGDANLIGAFIQYGKLYENGTAW